MLSIIGIGQLISPFHSLTNSLIYDSQTISLHQPQVLPHQLRVTLNLKENPVGDSFVEIGDHSISKSIYVCHFSFSRSIAVSRITGPESEPSNEFVIGQPWFTSAFRPAYARW
jgi:hypothetical protein